MIAGGEPLTINSAMERAGEKRAAPVVGLTVGQLQRVAEQVAIYLRNSGLPLAQAYIPVQEVGVDGIVLIDVVEAKLGKVVVEGAKRMPPKLIAASANPLLDAPLTRTRIESTMLTAQSLPGTSVIGTFRPGENAGETDLVLKVQDEETFEFRIGGDNYGTEFAGEYRLRGDAIVHNPIGIGDQLAMSVVQAFSPADTTYGAASYSVPLGRPQIRAHVRFEKAAFVASNQFAGTIDVKGDNDLVEGGVRWDVLRSRSINLNTGLAYQVRRANVEFDDIPIVLTDDLLKTTVVDLAMQRFDARFKGVDFLEAAFRKGEDKADGFEVISNEDKFWVLDFGYSRYQRITDNQTLLLVTRAQWSDDLLSALERFSLGGPDSVRAYPVSEILVDRGVLASIEYRIAAPGFSQKASPFRGVAWGKILQFLIFFDYASGKLAENDPGDDIHGAGGGLLLTAPHNITVKVTGATPTGSIDPSDGDDFRAYAEFSIAF
ncbi:MAG TPA: ShlB/FhaC/HecB family hemolysin secretion/activation protein [Vicinamibacterales bacterium]|nr:ShlB/FhaC/HecB family hemolysin secretion/activation protein [Vicinamibacterales bacterium]